MERRRNLYSNIWKSELDYIIAIAGIGAQSGKLLSANLFHNAGNRKSYGFRLTIRNGKIVNNVSGSAVARDLAEILLPVVSATRNLRRKHFAVRMSKNFYLQVIPYRLGKPVQWADE